jgi:hypothetical protein
MNLNPSFQKILRTNLSPKTHAKLTQALQKKTQHSSHAAPTEQDNYVSNVIRVFWIKKMKIKKTKELIGRKVSGLTEIRTSGKYSEFL